MRGIVLLPLPDGPMRATNSPAATVSETPRSASTVVSPSGYDFVSSRAWRIGAVAASGALATVVKTWGSSPRPGGSHLAVEEGGAFVGSVSGGCIEGAVIGEAQAAIADGQPRLLEFGVSDERAWEVGLACGGRVQVFVERVG